MLINARDTASRQKQIEVVTITDIFKISNWIPVASNSFPLDEMAEEQRQRTLSQGGLISIKCLLITESREREGAQKEFRHSYSPIMKA